MKLSGSPADAHRALVANGPVTVAPDNDDTMTEYARIVDDFSIHDGLLVASYRAQNTNAVITADNVIRDTDTATIWD